jgi:hypothetical protein
MRFRTLITMTTIATVALLGAACADDADDAPDTEEASADAEAEADGDDEAEGDEGAADDEAADGGDPTATQDDHPDLPDEWPDELPIHAGVDSLSNVIVEEDDDGTVRLIQAQYSISQPIEDAVEYFAALTDHGWDVEVSDIEEDGMAEFVEASLEGFGWSVRISADRPAGSVLYTYTISPEE